MARGREGKASEKQDRRLRKFVSRGPDNHRRDGKIGSISVVRFSASTRGRKERKKTETLPILSLSLSLALNKTELGCHSTPPRFAGNSWKKWKRVGAGEREGEMGAVVRRAEKSRSFRKDIESLAWRSIDRSSDQRARASENPA